MTFLILTILQSVIDLDTQVFLTVNSMHNTYWDTFMWLFSDKYVWIPLYVSLAFLIFKNYDPKVFLYCLLTVLVMIVFTDGVSSHILRPYIGRLRPSNLDNPISDVVHIVDGHRGGKFSFPSSHSANSWGLVFFIIYFFRQRLLTLFMVLWALVVCYSRLYLGVHYPGDLFVGMIVGFVGATLCYYVFRHFTGHQPQGDVRQLHIPLSIGMITIVVIALVSIVFRL